MTDKEIINAILYGKSLKEIFDAWVSAQKSKDKKQLFRIHKEVSEILINLCEGKDKRFTEKQVRDYFSRDRKDKEK